MLHIEHAFKKISFCEDKINLNIRIFLVFDYSFVWLDAWVTFCTIGRFVESAILVYKFQSTRSTQGLHISSAGLIPTQWLILYSIKDIQTWYNKKSLLMSYKDVKIVVYFQKSFFQCVFCIVYLISYVIYPTPILFLALSSFRIVLDL